MPCLDESHAPDNPVAERPYMHKSFCAAVSSPAFAQRGGSHRKRASAPPVYFRHAVYPRSPSSLFVAESDNSDGSRPSVRQSVREA